MHVNFVYPLLWERGCVMDVAEGREGSAAPAAQHHHVSRFRRYGAYVTLIVCSIIGYLVLFAAIDLIFKDGKTLF